MALTDAQLIERQRSLPHCGKGQTVVVVQDEDGRPMRAVRAIDQFGNPFVTMAKDLKFGEK